MGENEKGFRQLTDKIGELVPIISHMREGEETNELTRSFLQSLAKWVPDRRAISLADALQHRQLTALSADIAKASSQNRIAQFFNSADNAAGIVKHNALLSQILCGLTVRQFKSFNVTHG
jgi:hypothetical protein